MSSLTTSIEIPESLEVAIKAANGHANRIIDAYLASKEYVAQLVDPEYAQNAREKLIRSAVRGSRIEEVKDYDDVLALLSAVEGWQMVTANLEDKKITCFQGVLPTEYEGKAFTAYSTVREVEQQFGQQGLDTIKFKKGYQKAGDFYVCTWLHMPTDIITIQLREDESGIEFVKQWFAGREKTSIFHEGDGDVIVRCSSKIPQANATHPQRVMHRPGRGYSKPYHEPRS